MGLEMYAYHDYLEFGFIEKSNWIPLKQLLEVYRGVLVILNQNTIMKLLSQKECL